MGVRYQYSGTDADLPSAPSVGGGVTAVAGNVRYRYSGTDSDLPAAPSMGGGVSRQVWPTIYRRSGTAEQVPSPPSASITVIEDDAPPLPPPDHISTTFALPWSWDDGNSLPAQAPAVGPPTEDYRWPPGIVWLTPRIVPQPPNQQDERPLPNAVVLDDDAAPPSAFAAPDHISTTFPLPWSWDDANDLPISQPLHVDDDYQWPVPRPWNTAPWALQRLWDFAAGTAERPTLPPFVFEEDSWLSTPGLAPRWCWWPANRTALQFVTGWDDGLAPPTGLPIGPIAPGIKVVDILRQIRSVDCAFADHGVDLARSARSADLTHLVTSVDVTN